MVKVAYGYRMIGPRIEVDENQKEKVLKLFKSYLETKSIMAAGREAGFTNTNHTVLGRMLSDKRLLGNELYPAIIDAETFNKAQKIRKENIIKLNKTTGAKKKYVYPTCFEFSLGKVDKRFNCPKKQAEYVYAQIKEVM